jgi:EpsI family protein
VVWKPVFVNPSATAERTYSDSSGRWVGVQLYYYRQQTRERKLVSVTNVIVASRDHQWNAIESALRLSSGKANTNSIEVRETRVLGSESPGSSERQKLRVWQVNWINGVWTSNDVKAKLLSAWDRLRGRGDDSAAVILFTSDAQPEVAEKALESFLSSNRHTIEGSLTAARDSASR